MPDIRQPWHKKSTDTPKSLQAFKEYLLMPERSLPKLAKEIGKSQRQLEKWSSEHKWVERCEAYDAYLLAKVVKKHEDEVDKMNERHIKESLGMQKIALMKLKKYEENPELINGLTAGDMIRIFESSVRIERTARGAAEKVDLGLGGKIAVDNNLQKVQGFFGDNGVQSEAT